MIQSRHSRSSGILLKKDAGQPGMTEKNIDFRITKIIYYDR